MNRTCCRSVFPLACLLLLAAASTCQTEPTALLPRAFRVTDRAQLFGGGPRALGEVGDYMLVNDRIRVVIQNAKAANMPKSNVESAIKKASGKEAENFQEVLYEGKGPHGIAILVETATDNPTRTVANVRMYFDRCGGALGTSGSVNFLFDRKGVFKVKSEGHNWDDLELELIDAGLEEMKPEEDEMVLYTDFKDFGTMQKALEDRNIETTSAALEYIPNQVKKLDDAEVEQVVKLIDRLEEDDDVLNVFHAMDMTDTE